MQGTLQFEESSTTSQLRLPLPAIWARTRLSNEALSLVFLVRLIPAQPRRRDVI
jgi:hypothetical protein